LSKKTFLDGFKLNKDGRVLSTIRYKGSGFAEFMVGRKIGNLRTIFFLVDKLLKRSKEEKWFLKCRIPQNERGVLG
jgi:hypothetical protein